MSKSAVIVVNIQNEYFPSAKLRLLGIAEAATNAARVMAAAQAKGDEVIFGRHESAGANAPVFTPGSAAGEINSAVKPATGEPIIVKH